MSLNAKTGARAKILAYLKRNGLSVLADIMVGIDEPNRAKAHSNISACVKDSLVARERDDVTNQPGYKITDDGKEWLKTAGSNDTLQAAPAAEEPENGDSEGGEADAGVVQCGAAEREADAGVVQCGAAERDLLAIHTLLAPRVAGPIDPSDINEVECARKAAEMMDQAADEISRLARLLDDKDDELIAQSKLVVDLRERLDDVTQQSIADTAALTHKNERLHEELEALRAELNTARAELNAAVVKKQETRLDEKAGKQPSPRHGFILRADERPGLSGTTYKQHKTAVGAGAIAIRKGARRVRIFALVPAGQLVQGAEYYD